MFLGTSGVGMQIAKGLKNQTVFPRLVDFKTKRKEHFNIITGFDRVYHRVGELGG